MINFKPKIPAMLGALAVLTVSMLMLMYAYISINEG